MANNDFGFFSPRGEISKLEFENDLQTFATNYHKYVVMYFDPSTTNNLRFKFLKYFRMLHYKTQLMDLKTRFVS